MTTKNQQSQRGQLVEQLFLPVRAVETEGGVLRFEAIVSEADYVNGNSRLYPESILFPAFMALKEKGLANYPGLVDHPDPWEPGSISDIGIAWEDLWFEGKRVIAKGRAISTSKGRDLSAAMESGIPIGFSTRGYGEWEEETRDGRSVRVMKSIKFETVADAVLTPSVTFARVRSVSKEDQERMNEELQAAQAALAEAEAKLAAAEQRATEAAEAQTTATEALTTENAALTQRVADLEAALAATGEAAIEAKLVALTAGHRFAATIVEQAKALGATAENAEAVVKSLTALVEAAATASNTGKPQTPAGDLSTDEDTTEDALPEGAIKVGDRVFTAEVLAELKAAGLY